MTWPPFVRSPQSLWATFQLAKTYNCRPSDLLGIDEQPAAFYLDRAVGVFGIHLENELETAEAKGKSARSKAMKKNMVLQKYLGVGKFAGGPGK